MNIIDIVLLGNVARNALTGRVPILNSGYWMSQHEPSKEGCRDESKEKTSFCRSNSRNPVVFPLLRNNVWIGDFYPAMLENKEDNKIKRLLPNEYDVHFGL